MMLWSEAGVGRAARTLVHGPNHNAGFWHSSPMDFDDLELTRREMSC